jgi:hypothetical protein
LLRLFGYSSDNYDRSIVIVCTNRLDSNICLARSSMALCNLPRDVIKLIIQYYPGTQWFQLSKELSSIASQAISPLDYRPSLFVENGALCWALENNKILAVLSLLKDPRIDPSKDDNFVMNFAIEHNFKEVVEKLLAGMSRLYWRFYRQHCGDCIGDCTVQSDGSRSSCGSLC